MYLQLGYRHFRESQTEGDAEMGLAQEDMGKALALHPKPRDWRPDSLDLVPHRAISLAGDGSPETELSRLIDLLFPKSLPLPGG